jgi:hypothetical protein
MLILSKDKWSFWLLLWLFWLSKASPLDSEFGRVTNRWRERMLFVVSDMGLWWLVANSLASYFLRKLPMNSLVNWLDFLCNLFGMCSLSFMCLITSSFIIHFQEKMWKVHETGTVNYCVKKPDSILLNMWYVIQMTEW